MVQGADPLDDPIECLIKMVKIQLNDLLGGLLAHLSPSQSYLFTAFIPLTQLLNDISLPYTNNFCYSSHTKLFF